MSQPDDLKPGSYFVTIQADGTVSYSPEVRKWMDRLFVAELERLRMKMPKHMQFKNRFIASINYNDPALNAHNKAVDQALEALDGVISKYGSEGTR